MQAAATCIQLGTQHNYIVYCVSKEEERGLESEGDREIRKFGGKGNGRRGRRKAAQGKTQEAVG